MRVCASSWKGEICGFLPRQERIVGETVGSESPGQRLGTARAAVTRHDWEGYPVCSCVRFDICLMKWFNQWN